MFMKQKIDYMEKVANEHNWIKQVAEGSELVLGYVRGRPYHCWNKSNIARYSSKQFFQVCAPIIGLSDTLPHL